MHGSHRFLHAVSGQDGGIRCEIHRLEGAPPEDAVHLSDMEVDMGEQHNLKSKHPEIAAELRESAETWRAELEHRWESYWLPRSEGTTTHPEKK